MSLLVSDSCLCIAPQMCVFLKTGQLRPLFILFSSLQTHITIFTTKKCGKCPSSIECRDSKSRPLQHESSPKTMVPQMCSSQDNSKCFSLVPGLDLCRITRSCHERRLQVFSETLEKVSRRRSGRSHVGRGRLLQQQEGQGGIKIFLKTNANCGQISVKQPIKLFRLFTTTLDLYPTRFDYVWARYMKSFNIETNLGSRYFFINSDRDIEQMKVKTVYF